MTDRTDLDHLTVLVPLHRSAPYVDVVVGNLRRLVGSCRLVVSDASGGDGALSELRAEFSDAPITWIGARDIAPGWIAHYNDLLARAVTPLIMWLPHDDEIDLAYLERCAAAVGGADDVVGAFGGIDCITGPGLHTVDVSKELPPHDPRTGASRAEQLLLDWNLGIAMRSVFRRDALVPIADTTERSEWADIVWLFGLVLEWDLEQAPGARYRKRFYPTSEHASWRPHPIPHALPHLLHEVDRRPELEDADGIRDSLISASMSRAVEVMDEIDHDRRALRALVEQRAVEAEARQAAFAERVGLLESELRETGQQLVELEALAEQHRADAETWRRRAGEQEEIAHATRRSGAFRVGAALTTPLRLLRRR